MPPILGLVGAIKGWKHRQLPRERKEFSSVALGTAVLANWLVLGFYVVTEQIGGVGIDFHIVRFTGAFLILSFLLLMFSIRAQSFRVGLSLASFLALVLWFSVAYAPQHWLARMNFESVTVDGRPVPAVMYIGNPRQSEAEAIALVHVPNVGDYFFDFGEETFREASKHDVVALPFGAWSWRQMTYGKFWPPLPSRHINECRIPLSSGRVLTVDF
ncbi:MAG TPA: hypothetical protein VMT28_11790 [Terriglobales bacterium]|nr:hypothetical protein [Terriglobales bacterium]